MKGCEVKVLADPEAERLGSARSMFSAGSIDTSPSAASCLLAFATQAAVCPVATGKAARSATLLSRVRSIQL